MSEVQLNFFQELNTLEVTCKINTNYLQAKAEKSLKLLSVHGGEWLKTKKILAWPKTPTKHGEVGKFSSTLFDICVLICKIQ